MNHLGYSNLAVIGFQKEYKQIDRLLGLRCVLGRIMMCSSISGEVSTEILIKKGIEFPSRVGALWNKLQFN